MNLVGNVAFHPKRKRARKRPRSTVLKRKLLSIKEHQTVMRSSASRYFPLPNLWSVA